MKPTYQIITAVLMLVASNAAAEIVAYPEYPAAIERDWAYDVSVTQGGESRSLVVYNHCEKSPLTGRTRGGDVNRRFCEFAFSGGPVRVDVRVCEDVRSYKVFPARLALESSFSNGVISVWLDSPRSFGIELNDYVKTILSVFAESPEDPADVPSRNDPNVLYVDGWVDAPDASGALVISNQCNEVYVAPGAVLNSRLYVRRQGVRVHGRGMILDPFSDIFRYDQSENDEIGVVHVQAQHVTVEDVKIVDARTYNYVSYFNNTTFRNVKAMSSMMCSDGITCGARDAFAVEGAWLYVGDNGLVVEGMGSGSRISDVVIGTSCNAIFPQGNNYGVRMEDVDVFRADEGLVNNNYNPGVDEVVQAFFFKNLSAVDCTLFSRFFTGANTGTLPKTFGYENVAIPASTGIDDWHSIGSSGGKTIRIYDDEGKPFRTCNYSLSITNLWVAGTRSDGFAASEIERPEDVSVAVVNNRETSAIPAVPNRRVVNWTCPWKRYVGNSLQRDVRYATPAAGEVRLVEPDMRANLLADRESTRSAWQRSPSWRAKLDATQVADGARIYRLRDCEPGAGMYNDITDAFLRRGNGDYRLSFEARVPSGASVPVCAELLSNEDRFGKTFTVSGDGQWHRFSATVATDFDLAVTELVGFHMKSESSATVGEIEYRNLSLSLASGEAGYADFGHTIDIAFPGFAGGETLTNFPVLVRLSEDIAGFSYADFNLPNGGDLRFYDADRNLLAHEIDVWDEGGVSTVWVKVPRLARTTVVSARYGCYGTPPAVSAKDVWSNGYVGVWHLGEGALPMKESSETSSDFTTASGGTIGYAAPGVVGKAVDFPSDGLYNALVAPDHDALDGFGAFTLEAWTLQSGHKASAGILSKRKGWNSEVAYFLYDAGGNVPLYVGTNRSANAAWVFGHVQTMGEWNHLAFSVDMAKTSGNVRGFLNGAMNDWVPDVAFLGGMPNCASDLVLGNLAANSRDNAFNGKIDEVRISNVARSAAWMKATYDTIADRAFAAYAVDGALLPDVDISNLLLKAATDKANPIGYVENEDIRFDFRLDGVPSLPYAVAAKSPAYVIWTRTGDDGVTVNGTNEISLARGFSVTTRLAVPGIVRMQGTLVGNDYKAFEYYDEENEKKTVSFGGGAGVATAKMKSYADEPADFDRFWSEAKAKLATVPFNDGNVELVDMTPSGISGSYTVYAAKIPCFGPRPVTGWLTVPKNLPAGGVPVQANFEGYGCITSVPKPPTWGSGQLIRFQVNAHGYDLVGHDDQYYRDFEESIDRTGRTFNGVTYTYGLAPQDYANPTNTYFYYMALRVVRAFDYLKTRSEWDGKTIIAEGGSQGGFQTMLAGGLVDGITHIRPSITWGCDIGCPWIGKGPYPSRNWGIPCVPGAFYFDAALHAKRVPRDCVAEITRLGMGDYTCPPRGVLLSYYNMKCQVTANLVQGSDHVYIPPEPNQSFTISKAAQAPEVSFAKEVTVAFSGYSGVALSDFPVLVRLSENIPGFSYADFTLPDGGDLRFFGADGNLLAHDVDTWNEDGVSTVWVKVPTLSSATAVMAKYGCSGTPPAVSAKDVWSNGYVGVWHLGEGALPMKESSETSSDFTSSSGDTIGYAADGVVGRSVDFPADGLYNALVAPDHDSLDGFTAFTLETWTFQREHKAGAGILSKRKEYSSEDAYYVYDSGSSATFCIGTNRNAAARWSFNQEPSMGKWNHLVYSADMAATSKNVHGYRNGVMNGWEPDVTFLGAMGNCASDLVLGNLAADKKDSSFNGRIDEVRISSVARSADWVKATYDTVMKPGFATYSTAEGTLSGYAAWANAKELAGGFGASDAKGVPNAARYAFDIDPEKGLGEIGEPVLQIVRDADGNPSVLARELAPGRGDVAFDVLATTDLGDWSQTSQVPMARFASDGLWKPEASGNGGYVFPDKMFFKFTVDFK